MRYNIHEYGINISLLRYNNWIYYLVLMKVTYLQKYVHFDQIKRRLFKRRALYVLTSKQE